MIRTSSSVLRFPSALSAPTHALLSMTAPCLAGELYVDPSGLGDHLLIQDAVDAALDDDLIIVRPGTFGETVVIDDKSLRVVAQIPGSVTLSGHLLVLNISKDQHVELVGFSVQGTAGSTNPALEVLSSSGPVHLQDLQVVGGHANGFQAAMAVSVVDSARLTITGSSFQGGGIYDACGTAGSTGLNVTRSRVAIWSSEIVGGRGRKLHLQ